MQLVMEMEIDEGRKYALTKFATKNGNKTVKESDHNMMFLLIKSNWTTLVEDKKERVEIYNYKNKDDFEKFREETSNNEELKMRFEDTDEDLNVSADRWLSIVNQTIQKCFKKVRINKNKSNDKLEKLFEKKEALKAEMALGEECVRSIEQVEDELEEVIDQISVECGEKNMEIAKEYLGEMNDPMTGFNIANTWSLKKKLAPKNTIDPPMAKKDAKGKLVTDKAELEKLYLETYMERLKANTMVEGLENLEEMKEFLYQMRLELCKGRKSRKWNIEDLEKVFKCLKNNKARDAHGHTYELYKNGGSDLKSSLLKLVNLVKEKQIYPKIFQLANITSLYKKRGEKSDFNSERGIFNTVKMSSILDRLVYNEKYSEIDESMSGSNIGARKERNIRDHLFVINAILHEASENKKNLDVEIYDIEKCFDKLWASETANDMFNAGLNDDKFVLVANSNSECQVAVKTPWGTLTERKTMENIEMQGGVLTPLKCSVTIDTLGKETLASTECGKTLYKYRDCVKIPALSFVDDILSVTECGPNSVKMNAYVQSKVDSKKLRLSDKKCVKMHIGGNKNGCPSLKVHETEMKISQKEKYLGDVITNDTKQDENIK